MMTFKVALHIFGISGLDKQTEESLTKLRRKLLKENHPDSLKASKYSIDEINEAYNILIDSLHGKSSSVDFDYSKFSVFKKKREKKTLTYEEYKNTLKVENRTINKLDEEYILYLLLNFKFSLKRNGDLVKNLNENYEFKYDKQNSYFVELDLNYELGDVLEINFENEKILNLNLNSVTNLLSLSVQMTLIDTLKLTLSVKQSRQYS